MKARLTFALPLYRAQDIAWLALESLCRQENIDFEWELIVIEESAPLAFGEDNIRAYEKRLAEVGCRTPITYIGLSEWVPLAQKWHRAAQLANSDGFLLAAGDDYANPRRLSETARLFSEGAEFVHTPLGYFYSLIQDTLCVYDHKNNKHPCGLDKAVLTHIIRNALPEGSRQSYHVDGWVFSKIRYFLGRNPSMLWDQTHSWKKGVFTDGMNNISFARRSWYNKTNPITPFRLPTEQEFSSLSDIVPKDIHSLISSVRSASLIREPSRKDKDEI